MPLGNGEILCYCQHWNKWGEWDIKNIIAAGVMGGGGMSGSSFTVLMEQH